MDSGTSDVYVNEVMYNAIVKMLKEKCEVSACCLKLIPIMLFTLEHFYIWIRIALNRSSNVTTHMVNELF